VALLLILMFIIPEVFCLWQQFDAHPEKEVFGRTGVSDRVSSSWTTNSVDFSTPARISMGQTIHFDICTSSCGLFCLGRLRCDQETRHPRTANDRLLHSQRRTNDVFAVQFIAIPVDHYLTIAFTFFAIIAATFIRRLSKSHSHSFGECLAMALCRYRIGHRRGAPAVGSAGILGPAGGLGIAVLLVLYLQEKRWERWHARLVAIRATASVFANLCLNLYITPALLKYQARSEAALYLNKHYRGEPVIQQGAGDYSYTLEFYLHAPVTRAFDVHFLQEGRLR